MNHRVVAVVIHQNCVRDKCDFDIFCHIERIIYTCIVLPR